ncbi:MAG: MarR family transcriptional regulator [Microbacterium sp.]|nr:MarR family transcriptional regulator [Microbacterium sp.]
MPKHEGMPERLLRFHDPRVVDPSGRLVDLSQLGDEELGQTGQVMNAMFRWREAEQRVSAASQRYMRLGETDMKALRFAIVMADQGRIVTARDIAAHLGISSASTTKLLDRLESGGHIRRTQHPSDRRALAVVVSPDTRDAAEATVGREHARRFRVAAGLTSAERETVIRFLEAMSNTSEDDWGDLQPLAGDEDGARSVG